jgi:hypothetical protein
MYQITMARKNEAGYSITGKSLFRKFLHPPHFLDSILPFYSTKEQVSEFGLSKLDSKSLAKYP